MQSPNRFYYTWRLLFLHHSFAWCFFFYLSFLFPPVEPGVFNCCVTNKDTSQPLYLRGVRFCATWQSTFSRQSLLFLKSAVRLLPGTDIVDAYLYVISFCTISGLFAASLCALDSLFRSNDFKYAAINTVAKDKMDDTIFIQSRSAK